MPLTRPLLVNKSRARAATVPAPTQVAYLWGAGATQAEVSYLGGRPLNVLMSDSDELGIGLSTRILARLAKRWRDAFSGQRGTDIEKLISLLAACRVDELSRLAERIRQHYFHEIRNSLTTAGVVGLPTLAVGLLRLHSDSGFGKVERLCGIVTTNHDGLLQTASQEAYGTLDVGFPFISGQFTPARNGAQAPPILQLHGSFTWNLTSAIAISSLEKDTRYSRDMVWIPPTILKESKDYPFNKLAGLAYELLSKRCDVLRVVGSSLTQNDWNILSLIFNAQRQRERDGHEPFRLELIMPDDVGRGIMSACSYLKNVFPIGDLGMGQLALYKTKAAAKPSEMDNPMAFWMKQMILHHIDRKNLDVNRIHRDVAAIAGVP